MRGNNVTGDEVYIYCKRLLNPQAAIARHAIRYTGTKTGVMIACGGPRDEVRLVTERLSLSNGQSRSDHSMIILTV